MPHFKPRDKFILYLSAFAGLRVFSELPLFFWAGSFPALPCGTCHGYLSAVFIFGFCLWHLSDSIMLVAVIVAAQLMMLQLFWVCS